ncbi:hypothetical protein, partial [Pseudoflavonifractor phocaeensis]|uniref:hypothetical protein n=1 Tax=Pseudoflavonifractor phocaeensis TaxID=1870988 RepID=UPI001F16E1D4
ESAPRRVARKFGAQRRIAQAKFTFGEHLNPEGPHRTLAFYGKDWRMPSDTVAALWMEKLKGLE